MAVLPSDISSVFQELKMRKHEKPCCRSFPFYSGREAFLISLLDGQDYHNHVN
jgi:hypothetical protein